jgi:predicted transcriptional regulator
MGNKKPNCNCNCGIPTKSKNIVLVKELDKVLYALAIRTTAHMVYTDDTYQYTITELINDISNTLVSNSKKITIISERLEYLLEDAPEEYDTLKKLFDYINSQNDDIREEIYARIEAVRQELTQSINNVSIIVDDLVEKSKLPNIQVMYEATVDTTKDGDIYFNVINSDLSD